MTIDSLMSRPQKYETKMHEDVYTKAEETYLSIGFRIQRGFVKKEELVGFVYSEIYCDVRDELIDQALERGDHKFFGMTREEFHTKCYNGHHEDLAINPYIKKELFIAAMEQYLNEYQMTTVTNSGYVDHNPLQEVW